MQIKIAVIGAGNGGQAMAACFGMLEKYEVSVYDYFSETVSALNEKGEIELEGAVTGKGKIKAASTDIGEVIQNKDLIVVVNPAIYHNRLAKSMAPFLKEGQVIFLNPSNVFGAFAFKKALEDAGFHKNVTIGESNTLLYAARLIENGRVFIGGKKNRLLVSAFPACNKNTLYSLIRPAIKELQECDTVLETSMDSTNAMVHPLPAIMNVSWEESGIKFRHYIDGIGPTVGAYIEKMDAERIAVGEKLGLTLGRNLFSLLMEYKDEYNTTADTFSEVVKQVDAYREIYAPDTAKTRYIYEDIPTGMVPFAALGDLLGVSVKRMKFVISLCEMMLDERLTDGSECRNLENL